MYDVELQTARLSLSDLRDFLKFSLQSFGELQIQAAQKLDLSFGQRPFFRGGGGVQTLARMVSDLSLVMVFQLRIGCCEVSTARLGL